MTKITLPETGKELVLKSYKAKQQADVEKKQQELVEGKIDLFEFRKYVVSLCYPELVNEVGDWPFSDLSYLVNIILRYATGGPEAVKNL